jgi:hypothetical protein
VNRRAGTVGQENIPELLQQSFATRPTPATVLQLARFPFIFATDFCNTQNPMFTGLSAMMQNLPFTKHRAQLL